MPTTPDTFRRDRLLRLSEIEETHFWFEGRWALVSRLLNRCLPSDGGRVLDSGCGTGSTVRRLRARTGVEVVGLDRRPEGLGMSRSRAPSTLLLRGDATALPFVDDSFSLVLMLDVLEHVDDEVALQEVHRVLRRGGALVLTVPAVPALWSYRDVDAGHRRRYTLRSLKKAVAAAGLRTEETRYYQFVLFPLVVLSRWLGGRGQTARNMEDLPHPALNALFTVINRVEVRLGDYLTWPWGSTLAAVCRKD